MALTAVARGTGTHNSSVLSFTLSPSGNLAAGSLAVLILSLDNNEANGVEYTTLQVTDSLGNLWRRRATPLDDPGAASAGVQGAVFTTYQKMGALQTGTVITVRFSTVNTPKTWVMWEVVPDAGNIVTFIASGVNAGAATAAPTVTTGSITSGDMVIGALHNKRGTDQTVTGDADATNGAWSTQQTTEIGTTTTGQSVSSQYKVVSGTATQTYNPTLGVSSEVILSWIQLRQVAISVPVAEFACGGECAALLTHWEGVSAGTPTRESTLPRTGVNSILIDPAAVAEYARHNAAVVGRINVVSAYVKYTTLPGADAEVIMWATAASQSPRIWVDEADNKLKASCFTGTIGVGPVVTLGVWYRIDAVVDSSTGTTIIYWAVDGVPQPEGYFAQAAMDIIGTRVGNFTVGTQVVRIDDVFLSQIDWHYPIGEHSVVDVGGTETFTPAAGILPYVGGGYYL